MKRINKPQLVLLEWEDSAQPKPEWVFMSDIDDPDIVKCMSVGWLIKDGKDVKALAPNYGNYDDPNGEQQASGIICIPTCSITRTVKLKETK